jgi:hypothetical protein
MAQHKVVAFSSAAILVQEKRNQEAEPKASPSPPATEKVIPLYVFPTSSVEQNDSITELIEDDFPREILYSARYKCDQALNVVGLEAAKERSERTLPKQGDVIMGTCALCHITGVAWKKVVETMIDLRFLSCSTDQAALPLEVSTRRPRILWSGILGFGLIWQGPEGCRAQSQIFLACKAHLKTK